jgi:RNA polymerase subunit RPABC4/transcription elongation factor Spt4
MEKNITKYPNVKNIFKVASLILMVMFFVPLFTVSCEAKEFSFSAARLTTGYSYHGEELVKPYVICSLLFILPLVFFIACYIIKNKTLLNLVGGISGIINIILLVSIITKAKSEAESDMFHVDIKFGFYLSFIINLILAGIAICELLGISSKIPLLRDCIDTNSIPTNTVSKICAQCGTILKSNYDFCGECGTKYEEVIIKKNRFCTNCGNEVESGYNFCNICGSKID